ncbi:substrate-binding domain-containing protein [Streptomyces somaliensis]|uniref:Phosphate ABC transporter substrate-binding protein n=1 Tax=Streptomyces somaliensis (strain ATCC 33201 / DSM 40738 / JCM 12659 / KCTC 9044 / NCTC 11332 / NRRL B-12077 / IP 733) TaxID=1134445 RepID=A0AA44DA76_STRE0|nr:substrate-binding domain-containing protein [Streptomyces somaliensis]NKY13018.1 phosphate ABC transporter substrate-binding protein [Streptomyces somaliensis DSM 40738]
MEWFSAENVIAVLTALLGVLASVAALWYERRVPRRKRLGYRVQMDTPIGSNVRDGGRANVRVGLFGEGPDIDLSDATLVLLRIENDGPQSVGDDDYTSRPPHGLTVEFTGREIRGVAVTQPGDADHLMEHFTPEAGMGHSGGTLHLPRVPLNPGEHFKLLVLLTGGSVGSPVRVTGGLRDGEVRPNTAIPSDDKPPVFSHPARVITVLLTACVVTLACIIVGDEEEGRPPIGCATGTLTVVGSTAFAPVAQEVARKYEKDCPGSTVTVDARGTSPGIHALAEAGAGHKGGSPAVIALSDGPKPDHGYERLRENRVAVSVFAMIVNDRVPLRGLTTADVRRIYRGEVRRWSELGGPDLPVVLVSRNSNSGTREVFQRRVLQGYEPASSSRDCRVKTDPAARVLRCEVDSTQQAMAAVAEIPGALGYSELRAGQSVRGLHRLALDGRTPSIDDVAESGYPYREIEYAYTYGRPPANSLVSSFLDYLVRGSGQGVISTHGHIPCMSPEGLPVCAGPRPGREAAGGGRADGAPRPGGPGGPSGAEGSARATPAAPTGTG